MADAAEPGTTLRRPGRWVLQRAERSGWFATRLTWDLPDGSTARWASRQARRRGRVELRAATGVITVVEAEPVTARRLARINRVAAAAFVLGGALFALGAVCAQLGIGTPTSVAVVYLVGGVFFSLGGYASLLQAVNGPTDIDEHGSLSARRWRWWSTEPHHIGWLSAAVLFAGTLFFGVSLVGAFAQDLTPRQSNGWVWLPDMLGCLCFLASGHLALVEVCEGRLGLRPRELGWWVVVVNQVGSVLFFLAGLAAFVRPATSAAVDVGLVNWGTCLGAVCFVAGGALQAREQPEPPGGTRIG